MFIRNQIDAKKMKHTALANFLKDQDNGLSLWANVFIFLFILSCFYFQANILISLQLAQITQLVIEENGEKLVAALNLRTAQTSEGYLSHTHNV